MTLANSLAAIADDPKFVPDLVSLAQSLQLNPEDTAILQAYAEQKQWALAGLASALGDASSEEELYSCLASAWLEQRFEWQRCNMVLSYQAVRSGEPHALTMALASACSSVMQRVEELLHADDRDRWCTVAVELIAVATSDLASRWGDETVSLSAMS